MAFSKQAAVLGAFGLAICSAVTPVKVSNDSQVFNPVGVTYQQKLSDGIRRLNEIADDQHRRQLRGSIAADQDDKNYAEIMGQVKDVLEEQLDHLKGTISRIESSTDKAEAIGLISSFLEDSEAVEGLIADTPKLLGDTEQDPVMDSKPHRHDNFQLSELELDDLKGTYVAGGKNAITHMQKTVDVFGSIISKQSRRRASSTSGGHYEGRGGRAQHHSYSGSSGAFPKSQSSVNRVKLPSLNAARQLLSKRGRLESRRHLQQVNPLEQCQACDADDFSCNCSELYSCAGKLSWYDFAVLFLGGYVHNDPDSVSYGQLTVDSFEDVNVFESRTELGEKIQRVRGYLTELRAPDEDGCPAGLELSREECQNAAFTFQKYPLHMICLFVERDRPFNRSDRDGGFPVSLEEHGFVGQGELPGFTWLNSGNDSRQFSMYCAESDHVTLPATTTSETVHGICTNGHQAAYDSTTGALNYTAVDIASLNGGPTTMWGDRNYPVSGFENTPCDGGTFLRPSLHKAVERGTIISVRLRGKPRHSFSEMSVNNLPCGCIFYEGEDKDLISYNSHCQPAPTTAPEVIDTSFDFTNVGEFGVSDFFIEMDVRGRGTSISETGKNYGALFIRSGETKDPYSGPSAFIFDNGDIRFRIRKDEAFTIKDALPNPHTEVTRHLEFSRVGDKLVTKIDQNIHQMSITKDIMDVNKLMSAPLRFRGNHMASENQGLHMEVSNIAFTPGQSSYQWDIANVEALYNTPFFEGKSCSRVSDGERELYDFFWKNSVGSGWESESGRSVACATFCHPYTKLPGYVGFSTESGSVSYPLNRCLCFFDNGKLPDPNPVNNGAASNTAGTAVGPVNSGSSDGSGECYPYKFYNRRALCKVKTGEIGHCKSMLSEFTTACYDDQCDNPNIQATQLAVSEVCDAVDTRVRLSIEVMGRFYDFQNKAHKTVLIGDLRDSEPSQDVCPSWLGLSREECRNAQRDAWLNSGISDIVDIDYDGDYLQIGNWRLARTRENGSNSHLSISSQTQSMTSQIFRSTGTLHPGPRSDYHGFDLTGSNGLTNSGQPIIFGHKAVQIRDWRIRQVDSSHLSVTNENDNVSRIFRSDGTVHGNNKSYGGYVTADLGEPACAYLTSSFLQIGDWRFGEITDHLSVTHKYGKTAMIYRDDGTIHPGPRTDYNAWALVDDEVLAGTKDGCSRVICLFVEVGRGRHGGFLTRMFTEVGDISGFSWSGASKEAMYCAESDHVTLPPTATKETVHGICTNVPMETYSAAATTNTALSYTAVDVASLNGGPTTMWDDRDYDVSGFENTPCRGGTFLRPSRHKDIGKGTVISISLRKVFPPLSLENENLPCGCILYDGADNKEEIRFNSHADCSIEFDQEKEFEDLYSSPYEGSRCRQQGGGDYEFYYKNGVISDWGSSEDERFVTCASFCHPYTSVPGYVGFATENIDGGNNTVNRCLCFFDDGKLPGFNPVSNGAARNTAGAAVGPVNSGRPSTIGKCYPYRFYNILEDLYISPYDGNRCTRKHLLFFNGDYEFYYKNDVILNWESSKNECATFCHPYTKFPGYVGFATERGSVDNRRNRCLCFFDSGKLPDPNPVNNGAASNTAGTAFGPVNYGSSSNRSADKCYPYRFYNRRFDNTRSLCKTDAEERGDSHEVKHAVRCCADEILGQEDQWPVSPLAPDSTCRALEQTWTGDLPFQSQRVPNTPYGYTGYKDRKPNGANSVIDEFEGVKSVEECAQDCTDDPGCVSFFHLEVGKRVFATSEYNYRGNLGGLEGADGKCQTLAEAAGLPGTYKAWLSDRDYHVASRFDRTADDVSFRLTGPQVDSNESPYPLADKLADDWSDLTSGRPLVIDYDENGEKVSGNHGVWTGTNVDGTWADSDCDRWLSSSGRAWIGVIREQSGRKWTTFETRHCGDDHRLYCFQQDVSHICSLSSSTDHYSKTDQVTPADHQMNWFFKAHIEPNGYEKYSNRHWDPDEDIADIHNVKTVQNCANMCSADSDCVSFAYGGSGSTDGPRLRCRLSKTIDSVAKTIHDDIAKWDFYLKEQDDNQDNCVFLPYREAEIFCEEKGGRLCTSDELAKGCAAFTGCSFDDSNAAAYAWTSTAASPETCEGPAGDSASYASCKEFVAAFDALYDASPTDSGPNPMRNISTVAVGRNFSNVMFPSDVAFNIDTSSGVATFDSYLYEFELSNDEAVQFCGAVYGPPLELTKACDASIDVLLGQEISIGLLSSTSKVLRDFGGQYTPSHRWTDWFVQLVDSNLISLENELSDFYEGTEDNRDEPRWLEFYLSIQDENPYYSPRLNLPVYCVDLEVNPLDPHERIGSCPRAWINNSSWNVHDENPYQWQEMFDILDGPDVESCPKCDATWLEMNSNAFFNTSDPCHSFFYECVEGVERLYQCGRFWDKCRSELNAAVGYWEYPRRQCDIEVCDEEWLVENPFNPEDDELACYDFAEHCLSEFKAEYPDVEYPIKYCSGNPDLTCQLDWVVDNPADLGDEECNKFKDYCQRQLLSNHSRYVWPIANVTVDDIMPGYCCLDTPTDTDDSNVFWGERYTSSRSAKGMTCQMRGLFHTGLSEDACSNVGGNWFRTACINLYTCIEARPRVGEAGYKETFEQWTKDNQIAIYDPHDEEQCEQARTALGYAPDYIDDFDVCQTFNDLLCDPFFEDLEFLDNNKAEKPSGFQQLVYTPIEYPPDKALFFEELPKERKIPLPEVLDEETEESINGLEDSKMALFILKNDGFELINKIQSLHEDEYKIQKAKCDLLEKKKGDFESLKEAAYINCEAQEAVVEGYTLPGKNLCLKSTQPAWAFVIQAASAAVKSCEAGILFKTFTIWAFKQILWALHYFAKVAYSATTWLLYQKSKKGTAISRTYNGEEYTVGIYETLVQHDGWNHDALGVINSNMIKQHTQMRKELQNRHQDITNDVNQYTTCIANYLGTEIISRFPDTTVGPLNSLCRQLLGLTDRRRLEDGTEVHSDAPFNIDVSWGEESIVMQQQASMEMEIEILDKEERILKALSKIENAVGINCGNIRCEQEETNIGCPQDCANAESTVLSTTEETMASGFDKIKFTILAKRKVAITALSFFTKDALEESNVKISTMAGTYTNSLFSLDKWQNVLGTTVTTTAYSTGTASLMKFEFEGIQIVVEGGQCQSFEVYSDSAIMVQMSTNMTEGDVAYEDDALQIFTGGVMEDHSPKPIQFNGVIGYDGLARVPEISGSNSQGGIAMDQASATDLVLEQEMKSTKRKIAAIQRKVGQIDVLSTKLSALDDKMSAQEDKMSAKLSAHEDKMSAKLSAQEDKMSAKLSALDDKMSAIEGMLAQLLKKNEI